MYFIYEIRTLLQLSGSATNNLSCAVSLPHHEVIGVDPHVAASAVNVVVIQLAVELEGVEELDSRSSSLLQFLQCKC